VISLASVLRRGVRWLLIFVVACGSNLREMRDYESFKFWQVDHRRMSCDQARAVASPSTSFVLAERCEVAGVALPAGTGVTTWATPTELHVYPHDPLTIREGLTCRREHEVAFVDGWLSSCDLDRSGVLDGIRLAPYGVRLERGHLVSGSLDGDQDVGGLPLANHTYIQFRARRLEGGTLRVDRVIAGFHVPARSSVWFHANGKPQLFELSQPTQLIVGAWSGITSRVTFLESGAVETVSVVKSNGVAVDLVLDGDGHVTREIEHAPEEIQLVGTRT
jgi:hypothetical protein